MVMKRVVLPLFITVLVAACGIDPGAITPTSVPDTTITTAPDTTTTTVPDTTTTTAPDTTTTTDPTTTTTAPTTTTTTLPGEPTDVGPGAGDTLMVIGVRHDDVLNLRAAPGATQPVVATIPPTEMGLEALGETRVVGTSHWTKVEHGSHIGWVHMGYVGYSGSVDDGTAYVVDQLHEYPTAPTMQELGAIIAAVFASDDPQVTSRVVQVTPATSGSLAEVTLDVIGYADDAISGVRIHVFGEKVSDGYSLKSVEVMLICLRGVADGVCS
jgi:hypothetical protein